MVIKGKLNKMKLSILPEAVKIIGMAKGWSLKEPLEKLPAGFIGVVAEGLLYEGGHRN